MENASKALLMAASVLIGILVLSLAVYLFVSFGQTSAELHKQQDEQRLEQFNTQFSSYVGKEDGITIYDIVTIANLATENNIYYDFAKRSVGKVTGNDNYIYVELIRKTGPSRQIEKGSNEDVNGIRRFYNSLIQEDLKRVKNPNEQGSTVSTGEDEPDLALYDCKVEYSTTTRRVYKVICEERK